MMFLIVTLPAHISLAYSGMITNVKLATKVGDEKLAAKTDTVDITVSADIRDDNGDTMELIPDYMRLSFPGYSGTMTECSGETCTYTTGERDFSSQKYEVLITLVDPLGRTIDTEGEYFYVDGTAPNIEKLDVPSSAGDSLTISYRATDIACSGCGSFCAGLNRLEFSINGEVVKTEQDITGCSKSGTVKLPANAEGNVNVCLTAYDRFGQSSKKCAGSDVDYTPPVIEEVSLTKDDEPIKYAGRKVIDAVIRAKVGDAKSVTADLTGFNSLKPAGYLGVSPSSCKTENDAKVCYWDVQVYGGGSASIEITVIDSNGNSNKISKSFNILKDNTPPVVAEIGGEHKYLSKVKQNLTVTVTEGQSGMAGKQILLDLHQMGGGPSVSPEICNLQGGTWECVWTDVMASGEEGHEVTVKVVSVLDDASNPWDEAASTKSQDFIIDGMKPVILEIEVGPLGSDIETLRVDDVVEITALISDNFGIAARDVFADIGDLKKDADYKRADECTEINKTTWKCRWEYAGELDKKRTVKLNVKATDYAGNEKDSISDHVFGESYIAEVVNKEVNFWSKGISYDTNVLNKNFLWMSSTGTYVRSGLRLIAKGPIPYVHGFDLTSCQGTLIIPGKDEIYESYTVKDQFYYPKGPRSEKYAIIGIPNYDKDSVKDAKSVKIKCVSEVIQASSLKSAMYSPNEKVNTTIEIKLAKDIFTRPDIATIDKITDMEDELATIDGWISFIKGITNFLTPICTMFQLIRQLIDGVCIIWSGVTALYTGGEGGATCAIESWKMDGLWKGSGKGVSLGPLPSSEKDFWSLGFFCDLVLCEECGNFWSSAYGQAVGDKMNGLWPKQGAYWENNDLVKAPQLSFDPRQSLIVAVWCMPPCLPGILTKLQVYRNIIVTYNTCINVAATRGEDVGQCDDYFGSQVCQQIFGEFWYLIDSFIKQYITGWIMYAIEQKLIGLADCPAGWWGEPGLREKCLATKLYETAGWFLNLLSTFEVLEQISNHQWLAAEDIDSGAKERLDK